MVSSPLQATLCCVRRLLGVPTAAEPTDRQLLERFAARHDEEAFATLVRRHGPLVLGVGRRVLGREQDAEDVLQATFLVLARKAASPRWQESVAGWLYLVARRLAAESRARDRARRDREREAAAPPAAGPNAEPAWRELWAALDEELGRLSEAYRRPILLCYLEGLPRDRAARQLGWSVRTLHRRLERGLRLLRARLTGRGLAPPAALLAAALAQPPASAGPPAALVRATTQAALPFAAGAAPTGASAEAVALAHTALRSAGLARAGLVVVLAAGALAAAAGLLGPSAPATGKQELKPEAAPAARSEPEKARQARADLYGDPLPPGVLTRLGTIRYRYAGIGAAFLPDGKTVVTVQQGNRITFWDARTGRPLREIDTGRLSTGWHAAFSRGSKRLAISGALFDDARPGFRAAVRVFDLPSAKEVRTFERPPREGVNAVALSPDGKLLFILDGKGKLSVEEVATGAELLRQYFPGDVMAHLALSPDGKTLALASGPNTHKLYLWKWQAAEEPRELKVPRYSGRGLTFSPDGKLLAESGDDNATVRVWDAATGQLRHRLELPDHEPYRHHSSAFSPDGKVLAASGGTNDRAAVHLWDPATGKFLRRLNVAGSALAYSPDGTLLAGGPQVWDFAADKELSANDQAHHGAVQHVLTAAGDVVITASDDNTIRVWDAATGRPRRKLAHDGWVRDIALSPDGSRLASNSLDDTVCLWDVATGRKIYRLPGHGRLGGRRAVGFTADGRAFLSWGDDMRLRKWDVRTGKAVAEHVIRPAGVPVAGEDDVAAREKFIDLGNGCFTPDGKRLIVQAAGKFHVFDTATGKELRHFPSEGGVPIALTVSPDSKLLLATAWARSVEVKLPDGTRQITTPNAHPVAWGDLATGRLQKRIDLPEQLAGPVAFAPDGRRFAVASSNPGTHIRIVEVATGREVRRIEGFRGVVRSLAFLADGRRLVSGMEDSSALIWDLSRGP
jgi:RNA polymerase sigma factor (sigma-70 family)